MSLGNVGSDFRVPLRAKLLQSGSTNGGTYSYVTLFDGSGNLVAGRQQAALAAEVALPAPDGFSGIRVGHAVYDFTVDGGSHTVNSGLITPVRNSILPANAIIVGGFAKAGAALAGATATIAIGTAAGSSASALLGSTAGALANWAADAIIPLVPTMAVPLELTAAGAITVTIGTANLTAGQIEIFTFFVVPAYA